MGSDYCARAVKNRVFSENLVGLAFLVVCFLYEINPNPRFFFAVGKKWAQMPLLT